MYSHFKEINDIFISFRSVLVNLILSYGRNNKIFGFNKEKNMKKMVDTIFKKYAGKEYDKYEYFLEKLSNSLYFFDYIHDHKTLALGYLYLNEIENAFKSNPNIFLENNIVSINLIYNLCNSLNKGIDAFNAIGNQFEELYLKESQNQMDEKIKIKEK